MKKNKQFIILSFLLIILCAFSLLCFANSYKTNKTVLNTSNFEIIETNEKTSNNLSEKSIDISLKYNSDKLIVKKDSVLPLSFYETGIGIQIPYDTEVVYNTKENFLSIIENDIKYTFFQEHNINKDIKNGLIKAKDIDNTKNSLKLYILYSYIIKDKNIFILAEFNDETKINEIKQQIETFATNNIFYLNNDIAKININNKKIKSNISNIIIDNENLYIEKGENNICFSAKKQPQNIKEILLPSDIEFFYNIDVLIENKNVYIQEIENNYFVVLTNTNSLLKDFFE